MSKKPTTARNADLSAGKKAKPRKSKPATKNAAKTADNRQSNGQFGKGNRANPGGRPKENEELRQLAKQYTVQAILRLAELMSDDNGKTAVAACNAILDRGWGKPTQPLANDPNHPLVPVLNVSFS